MSGKNLHKIKLRQLGYRLVYSVMDEVVTVTVLSVGKRNRNEVYDLALSWLADKLKRPVNGQHYVG